MDWTVHLGPLACPVTAEQTDKMDPRGNAAPQDSTELPEPRESPADLSKGRRENRGPQEGTELPACRDQLDRKATPDRQEAPATRARQEPKESADRQDQLDQLEHPEMQDSQD